MQKSKKYRSVSVQLNRWCIGSAMLIGLCLSLFQVLNDYSLETNKNTSLIEHTIKSNIGPATQAAYNYDDLQAQAIVQGLAGGEFIAMAKILSHDKTILAEANGVREKTAWYEHWLALEPEFREFELIDESLSEKNVGFLQVNVDLSNFYQLFFLRSLMVVIAGLLRNLLLAIIFLQIFNHFVQKPVSSLLRKIEIHDYEKLELDNFKYNNEFMKIAQEFNLFVEKLEMAHEQLHTKNKQLLLTNEILLEHQVKIEAANAAKDEFLANMSHEFRTPLHGIMSNADLGKMKFKNADEEKTLAYFNKIKTSGTRLLSLVENLLDLSKLENKAMELNIQMSNIQQTIQGCVDELQPLLDRKKLKLIKNIDLDHVQFCYDEFRITQVIINILSNAQKFSDEQTQIKIETSLINESENEYLQVTISNTGVGISPSELRTIFNKFAQSKKTKTGEGGTGLGLSICRAIIEQHGGQIYARGGEKGQTEFVFKLPFLQN